MLITVRMPIVNRFIHKRKFRIEMFVDKFFEQFEVKRCVRCSTDANDFRLELWATQQTEKINREEQMDKYVRTTIRELMIYMVFVAILTIGQSDVDEYSFKFVLSSVVFGMISNNMYLLTKAMQSVFVDPHMVDTSNNKSGPSFVELNRMEDFWEVNIFFFICSMFSFSFST